MDLNFTAQSCQNLSGTAPVTAPIDSQRVCSARGRLATAHSDAPGPDDGPRRNAGDREVATRDVQPRGPARPRPGHRRPRSRIRRRPRDRDRRRRHRPRASPSCTCCSAATRRTSAGPATGGVTGPVGSQATQECEHRRTRRNARADCRIVGFVNSIQAYWTDAYAQDGATYQPAQTFIYDGGVDTGCGPATSAVGPFYCPPDQAVYLDLGLLRRAPVAVRRRRAGRSPRPTSSPTSTATTSRTSRAS